MPHVYSSIPPFLQSLAFIKKYLQDGDGKGEGKVTMKHKKKFTRETSIKSNMKKNEEYKKI